MAIANYKKMCGELFNAVVYTIDRLNKAVLSAEEIHISEEESVIHIAETPKDEDDIKE